MLVFLKARSFRSLTSGNVVAGADSGALHRNVALGRKEGLRAPGCCGWTLHFGAVRHNVPLGIARANVVFAAGTVPAAAVWTGGICNW